MDKEKEILFKPIIIDGIMTDYDISNRGAILRNRKTEKIINWFSDKDGYLRAKISVNNHRFTKGAHRLVAQAFIPNPENKTEINHIDGNKKNNDVDNLEWATRQENALHAIRIGLYNPRGESNGHSRYTEAQIREACKLMEDPKNPPRYISKVTKVSRIVLYEIKKGVAWKHISKDYNFPEINYKFGSNNVNIRYGDMQVHKVCKLLEDGLYPKEIEKLTGVSTDTVQKIRKKEIWKQISDFYEFPDIDITKGENHALAKYTSEQIREVCKLLETTSDSYQKIADKTGVHKDTVFKIAKRGAWSEIAKDYKISR